MDGARPFTTANCCVLLWLTMVYRKGELSAATVDREWPHQVAVRADTVKGKANGEAVEAFCKHLSKSPRGHAVFHDSEWWVVFCFADAAHAESFRVRFDGVKFDPKDRGRGSSWARWRKPGEG